MLKSHKIMLHSCATSARLSHSSNCPLASHHLRRVTSPHIRSKRHHTAASIPSRSHPVPCAFRSLWLIPGCPSRLGCATVRNREFANLSYSYKASGQAGLSIEVLFQQHLKTNMLTANARSHSSRKLTRKIALSLVTSHAAGASTGCARSDQYFTSGGDGERCHL